MGIERSFYVFIVSISNERGAWRLPVQLFRSNWEDIIYLEFPFYDDDEGISIQIYISSWTAVAGMAGGCMMAPAGMDYKTISIEANGGGGILFLDLFHFISWDCE